MRPRNWLFAVTGAVLSTVLLGPAQAGETREAIRFGVLPINQPDTMAERFTPLIDYLRRATGYPFELRLYPTDTKSGGYDAAVRGLLSGETPFAYLAPVTIAQARHHDEHVAPAVCAIRDGSPTYVGHIAVRQDSNIERVEDLVGRRVIGASPSSTSGNLMPSGLLVEKGIDKSQFAAMDFAGGHDKAAMAVLSGEYDACWINDKNFRKFRDQGVGLRSIWTHAPVPEMPITVNTSYVSPEVLQKVTEALLQMHEKDLAAMQAIDPKYEQWLTVDWAAYQPVKETIDKVHGPDFYALEGWPVKGAPAQKQR